MIGPLLLFVTPHKYSESSFHWDKVKQHLLDQGNLSLDVNNLQEIMETFSQKLHLLQGSNLLESEKVGLKLNIQKTNITASVPSWEINGETVSDFIFLGSKITADGDCSHETS